MKAIVSRCSFPDEGKFGELYEVRGPFPDSDSAILWARQHGAYRVDENTYRIENKNPGCKGIDTDLIILDFGQP